MADRNLEQAQAEFSVALASGNDDQITEKLAGYCRSLLAARLPLNEVSNRLDAATDQAANAVNNPVTVAHIRDLQVQFGASFALAEGLQEAIRGI